MVRARTLLGLILVGVPFLAFYALRAIEQPGIYMLTLGAMSILYLTAGLAFTTTLTSLDGEGRIARDSFAFKYLSCFHDMSAPIRVCKMYWAMCAGVFLVTATTCVVGIIPAILVHTYLTSGWGGVGTTVIGFLLVTALMAAAMWLLFGLPALLVRHTSKIVRALGYALTTLYLLALISLLLFATRNDPRLLLVGAGTVVGILLLGVVVCGAVMIARRHSPRLKNTLVGKLADALYGKMCPVILIAPRGPEARCN